MEVYVNKDGSIAKYLHDDGSETSIKTWPEGMKSCGGSSREKFNVFASCSYGCLVNCKFCFLTSKGVKYSPLEEDAVSQNVIDAVKAELKRRPELKQLPMNLSWMGMGDAWFNLSHTQHNTTLIFRGLESYISKIEGVDIATTLPCIRYDDLLYLRKINNYLISTQKLTDKPIDRTNVRIFYSLHSTNNQIRKSLIPKTINVNVAVGYFKNLCDEFNVIYHCMFLDNVNDQITNDSVQDIVDILYRNTQLRILRYNECPNSRFKESDNFYSNIKLLQNHINDLKVQESPGSEVSAACGMFLMKYIK